MTARAVAPEALAGALSEVFAVPLHLIVVPPGDETEHRDGEVTVPCDHLVGAAGRAVAEALPGPDARCRERTADDGGEGLAAALQPVVRDFASRPGTGAAARPRRRGRPDRRAKRCGGRR